MKFHRSVKFFKAVRRQIWSESWRLGLFRESQGEAVSLWPGLRQRQCLAWVSLDPDIDSRLTRLPHSKYQE